MSVNATDPMIGRLVDGRYQIRSRIARGGMATVYLATDLRLERRVAVKIMHGHLADDSAFKQRFIQEARSAARLAHPNVVNVFDQGQDEDSAYLVMEYLPGITLRELLQENGPLTPAQTLDIAEAVLSGLSAAHRAGIVHRDLKPENVLLADDGRIKIGDFGLARAATANTATGAALLGTIAYLAPELVTRGSADTRSDIYAVGIMMYEMLTGEQPFKGEQPLQIAYQHANDSVPAPSEKASRVPAELDELVLWATARDPQRRPTDAAQLLEQVQDTERMLQTALETGGVAIQRTMVLPPARSDFPTEEQLPFASSTGETVVLHPAAEADPGAEPTGATSTLAIVGKRRRRRAPLVIALIVVLALVAGGVGWWFGAGPGVHSTIPDSVVGSTPEEAEGILAELRLTPAAERDTVYSLEVPEGRVVGTDPPVGESVRHGSEITLVLSLGPRPIELDALAGRPLTEVTALFEEEGLLLLDTVEQFSDDVPEGVVISAAEVADGEQTDMSDGGSTFEGREFRLVVSVGAVPQLRGSTPEEAIASLRAVRLEVDRSRDQQSYHEEIAEGRVIGLVRVEGPRHPGDTVGLVISRGPEPVPVPGVVNRFWSEASNMLTEAGFTIDFADALSDDLARLVPHAAVVREVSPNVGETLPRGSTVTVRLSAG